MVGGVRVALIGRVVEEGVAAAQLGMVRKASFSQLETMKQVIMQLFGASQP